MRASNGAIRFETPDTTPTTTSGERLLYVDSSNVLQYDDGTSTTALGASGVVSSFSLNDAYDDGSTITVDSASVTLSANIATTALQITQSGAGDDIQGTSNTWAVDASGNGEFAQLFLADNAELRFGNTVGTSDAQITWNGTLLNVAGAVDFDSAVTTQGALTVGTTLTVTGSAGSDSLTLSAGDVSVADGSVAITDADNADTVTITNNTVTTSSATTGGIVEIRSTSLTTGTALNIELTEGQLNGGEYIRCYDVTGTEDVFNLGENGAVTILGAGGSDNLTLTNGDVSVADGSITVVDADNATSLSVTNNSANTNDMVEFVSSGTSSGTMVRMTSTGTITTTGSVLELVADSATTSGAGGAGRGLFTVSGDALTTGIVATLSSSANAATSSQLLNLDHTAAVLTGAKTGQLVDLVASRTQTGAATVSDNFDALSIIRSSDNTNAGGTLNEAGACLFIQNTAT